jgi:hypothetical protein
MEVAMNKRPPPLPVVLELAPLPREQVGPFLLLGLEKTAGKEAIEASWAQRVIWARKGLIKTPLEDVNWAREVIQDAERRARSDAASLNPDTTAGALKQLAGRYDGQQPGCQPLDVEKPLADYTPAVEVPDPDAERAAVPVPDVPQEVPMARQLLGQLAREPLDPWDLRLLTVTGRPAPGGGPEEQHTQP